MQQVNFTSTDPAEQLACDEALLDRAEEGRIGECLRLYELSRPTVVMGLQDQHRRAARWKQCHRKGVVLLRRRSGGGTVLLGPGCLLYSLVLRRDRQQLGSITKSYRWILGRLAEELSSDRIEVSRDGTSDLVWEGRKVGGSAQQRKRDYLLHHGTLLYDMRPELMEEFLGEPRLPPPYRAGRKHREFVVNLPYQREQLRGAVRRAFGPVEKGAACPPGLQKRIASLVEARYHRSGWTLRR
jgi:lipoate-protein ligase A